MSADLGSIIERFACRADCPVCHGSGIVCEDHPMVEWDTAHDRSLGDIRPGTCEAAGMPCPAMHA